MEKSSSAYCKDGAARVPRVIFKSDLCWIWHEAVRSYVLHIGLIWMTGLCTVPFIIYFAKYSKSVWQQFVRISILSPFIILAVYDFHRGRKIDRLVFRNVKILAEAVETVFAPGSEVARGQWDEVATKMNCAFFTKGLWKTPYCFFDGGKCQVLFRRFVLRPNFEKNSQDKFESMDLCEKEYVSAAVEFYQQKLEEQFNAWATESELSRDVFQRGLPRDSHWNRFTWVLNTSSKFYTFHVALASYCGVGLFDGVFKFYYLLYVSILAFYSIFPSKVHLFRISPITTSYRIRYLATIANVAPGKDLDRWDIVAKRVNSYFSCPNSKLLAQDCFYDGEDCMKCFEKHFKPLASQKSKKDNIATYELVPLVSKVIEASS